MSGHLEHLGLEISTMPSNEKEEAKISCKCGVCELTLADGKSTVSFLCGCQDCRQALQWGFKNGGVKPDPLPRLYYMRSDIIDVKGRNKMISVKLRERLIPLSQVDQYLVLAGRSRNGAEFDFFGRC